MIFKNKGFILVSSLMALSFSAYLPGFAQDVVETVQPETRVEKKIESRETIKKEPTDSKEGEKTLNKKVEKTEKVEKAAVEKSENLKKTEEKPSSITASKKDGDYKDLVEKKKTEQKKTDQAMLKAANEIDGVNIDATEFEEKKGFQWNHLNPFHWIFKPVTDMQKRVIHLEKQMMRLEAPIASLQKPMVGLREDMVTVEDQLDSVDNGMTDVNSHMKNVNGSMQAVETRLSHVERQLDQIYEPVVKLQKPVTSVGSQLTVLKKDLHELKDVVSLTSTLILIAVVAVGLLICVGTPIAALFAWRHRRFIIEKFGNSDYEDVPMTEEEETGQKAEKEKVTMS